MAIQSHCGDQTTAMLCSSGAQAKNVGSSACWTTAAYLNHPSFKLLLLFASVLNLHLSLSCQLNVWRLSIAINTAVSFHIPYRVSLLESRRLQRRSAHGICIASALQGFFQASFQRTIPVGSEEILLPRGPILECQRSVFPSPVKVSRSSNVKLCFASGSSCLLLCNIET